jgi:hypothetical protein
VHARGKLRRQLGPTGQRERERGSGCVGEGNNVDKRAPPRSERGRGRTELDRKLRLADLWFFFYSEFCIPFLFLFTLLNSNQIKP